MHGHGLVLRSRQRSCTLPIPLRRCRRGPGDRLCLAGGHCARKREQVLLQLLFDPTEMSRPKLMLIHLGLLLKTKWGK